MGAVNRDIRTTRERLLQGLLRVSAIGGLLAYVPSAYLSVVERYWSVLAADSLACVYVIVLALSPGISARTKIASLLVISYLLGLVLLVVTGPFGAGHLFIFAFVLLAALFGRLRGMVAANALALVTHAGIAVASSLRLVSWPQDTGSVIVISANFILVSLVLSFSTNFLIRGLEASAGEEKKLRIALEMMLREIEHRVKNNLQVIASLVNIKSRASEDPGRALTDIRESLLAISVVHQLLYRREAFYLVELSSLLSSLLERLQYLHRDIEFRFEWEGPKAEMDGDCAVSLGLMVNELILNSVKHAFPSGGSGLISMRVAYSGEDRRLVLELADDGIGVEGGGRPGGTGLKIVAALARQLRATMEVLEPPGMRYRFVLVLDDQEAELAAGMHSLPAFRRNPRP